MEGNTTLGASSPANQALHIPDPLSITTAATSSSFIMENWKTCLPVSIFLESVTDKLVYLSLRSKWKYFVIGVVETKIGYIDNKITKTTELSFCIVCFM